MKRKTILFYFSSSVGSPGFQPCNFTILNRSSSNRWINIINKWIYYFLHYLKFSNVFFKYQAGIKLFNFIFEHWEWDKLFEMLFLGNRNQPESYIRVNSWAKIISDKMGRDLSIGANCLREYTVPVSTFRSGLDPMVH